VTCGPKARIYDFKKGDFVYHPVFEQEKFRIDILEKMPRLGWKEHPVQRSFDAFQFIRDPDQGVFWRGMRATYPVRVRPEHLKVAMLCRKRQIMFQGLLDELPLSFTDRNAIAFTALQNRKGLF
jgi:hypothetical protein